ncbi:MAG TPA: nucleotidyltransferase family protein [Polyangiaceae bacterium]|jgi:hypothetical protein|nr:nucleotidyltransferase family protein [Polyangiaceae bacterium]
MAESTRFFEGTSSLQDTLGTLIKKLDELGIPYVVVGGMALAAHGYARMTEDLDVLVTRSALKAIHTNLVGLGYRREFDGSKNIRDTRTGVKIEFLLTGDFPGSGKKQPVSFPEPQKTNAVEHGGVKFIGLDLLVQLKLASGLTGGADRAKDLVDVQQLISLLRLPKDFGHKLHEYVRPKYEELWDALHATQKRYVRLWRNKYLTIEAKSLDDMISTLAAAADELRQMQADGVVLDSTEGVADDYAHLVTTSAEVAEKYGMHEESEFFGEEDE